MRIIVFLASVRSDYVKGFVLAIDSGWLFKQKSFSLKVSF